MKESSSDIGSLGQYIDFDIPPHNSKLVFPIPKQYYNTVLGVEIIKSDTRHVLKRITPLLLYPFSLKFGVTFGKFWTTQHQVYHKYQFQYQFPVQYQNNTTPHHREISGRSSPPNCPALKRTGNYPSLLDPTSRKCMQVASK